ncbi:MAG: hypothetical protein EP332_04665 [Bacteroidetes bacterium]|nr:MAG: hypothetical protein EP332_04665 [Bacteroidota bacterium]
MKNETLTTQPAHKIPVHPLHAELYDQILNLDSYYHLYKTNGPESCPPIYVNRENQAIRHIPDLLVIQKLYPDFEIPVFPFEADDLEAYYIIANANVLGVKTHKVRLMEIHALKKSHIPQQGKRTDLESGEKYNSNETIAKVLGVSMSYINRLERINAMAPGLIDKIDAADSVGGGAKMTVSGIASACIELSKSLEMIADTTIREKLYQGLQESELSPVQLLGLVQRIKQHQKAGRGPEHIQNFLGQSLLNEGEAESSEDKGPLNALELDIEVEVPERRVVFTISAGKDLDPEMLFESLFPMKEAHKYQARFVRLLEQIFREVNS